MKEVKNFTPMDLALLRRVTSRGLSLDIVASVENARPIETAIYEVVGLRSLGRPTFILRNEDCNYASQMRIEGNHAGITLLAPAPTKDAVFDPFLALIDAMVRQTGQRGAQFITAEVPVDAPAFELFRQAGFTVYSRESLYVLDKATTSNIEQRVLPALSVRPIVDDDNGRLNSLYANTVPQLVQQVAPPPANGWNGLAILLDERVMGFVDLHSGRNASLLHPYLHPELYDHVPAVLGLVFQHLPPKTVYVRLRAYQEWLRNALVHDYGFIEHARYALMARHTVVRQQKVATSPLVALESIVFAYGTEVALEIEMPPID